MIKNPTEEKYRNLKKTNKKIQESLMQLQPNEKLIELLTTLGYTDLEDGSMVCTETEDFSGLI